MIEVEKSKDQRVKDKALLLSINDHNIDDWLDFTFYNDINIERKIRIKTDGHLKTFRLREQEQLAIDLAEPIWRHCENDCEYCFINGLPRRSRSSLFFRDDDYRLSFLYGNFISMTNLTKTDYQKIFTLSLSPLYVSVHCTNPALRTRLFNNEAAADIVKQLRFLVDNNITVHAQIVIMPGINDGEELVKTINDLISLYPGIASIGIVPLGRTRYNNFLEPVDRNLARTIVNLSRSLNLQCRKKFKKGVVYASDEIFLIAGDDIPERIYYDDMPQHENGIGMIRHFLDSIKSWSCRVRFKKKVLILTGQLAYPFIMRMKQKMVDIGFIDRSDLRIHPVTNSFFGPSVTIAGLIGGTDFQNAIREERDYDHIILPPYCMNDKNQMIDDQEPPPGAVIAPVEYEDFIQWLQSL